MFDKMKFPSASAPSIFFRAGVKDREQMGLQERIALSRSTDRSRSSAGGGKKQQNARIN
ncbi:hypothetical protein [Rhizobium leguminosarum]|jgi:hypothetical protein